MPNPKMPTSRAPDGFENGLRVTVFASSCEGPPGYMRLARELGEGLAKAGLVAVFGGGSLGCMGAMAGAAEEAGGWVHGITHRQFMGGKGSFSEEACETLQRLDVVHGSDLNERKMRLFAAGHCLVCLPGGVGTFDELFVAVALLATGFRSALPICVINTPAPDGSGGFYDGIIAQLARADADGLLRKPWRDYLSVVSSAEEAVAWCISQVESVHTLHLMPHTFDVMSALAPDGGTVRAVTDALDKVSGVQAASCDVTTKVVRVTGTVRPADLLKALEEVGMPAVWKGVTPLKPADSSKPPRVNVEFSRGLFCGVALGMAAAATLIMCRRTRA